jgi:hypothetical protein
MLSCWSSLVLSSILIAASMVASRPPAALGASDEGRLAVSPHSGELLYLPSAEYLTKAASVGPRAARLPVTIDRVVANPRRVSTAADRLGAPVPHPSVAYARRPPPRRIGGDPPPIPD